MAELARLIHEISLAFGKHSNLRTLLRPLATKMAVHCSLVEIETVELDRSEKTARIAAYAPAVDREWKGERSARFLHRQGVVGAHWSASIEPARVSISPVVSQIKVSVGSCGIMTISFSTDIPVDLGQQDTEILVDVLRSESQRLGQLDAVARRSYQAHRYYGELVSSNIDISVPSEIASPTDISVTTEVLRSTDIQVSTISSALVDCISRALQATQGRIYGDAGAAKLLGIKPSTLQSKMRKLGIERSQFAQ